MQARPSIGMAWTVVRVWLFCGQFRAQTAAPVAMATATLCADSLGTLPQAAEL